MSKLFSVIVNGTKRLPLKSLSLRFFFHEMGINAQPGVFYQSFMVEGYVQGVKRQNSP